MSKNLYWRSLYTARYVKDPAEATWWLGTQCTYPDDESEGVPVWCGNLMLYPKGTVHAGPITRLYE